MHGHREQDCTYQAVLEVVWPHCIVITTTPTFAHSLVHNSGTAMAVGCYGPVCGDRALEKRELHVRRSKLPSLRTELQIRGLQKLGVQGGADRIKGSTSHCSQRSKTWLSSKVWSQHNISQILQTNSSTHTRRTYVTGPHDTKVYSIPR